MQNFKLGDQEFKPGKADFAKLFLALGLIGATVWLFGFSPWSDSLTPDAARQWLSEQGGWGAALYVGALALLIALCVPVNPIIFIGATMFGIVGGTLLTFAASILGCLLGYGFARWAGAPFLRAVFKDKLDKFVGKLNEGLTFKLKIPRPRLTLKPLKFTLEWLDVPWLSWLKLRLSTVRSLAFVRAIPIIPGWLVNLACGMARIRFRTYAWTSLWTLVQCVLYTAGFFLLGLTVPGNVSLGWLFLGDFLFPGIVYIGIVIAACIVWFAIDGIAWLVRTLRGRKP